MASAELSRCPVCLEGHPEFFRQIGKQVYLRCPTCLATIMAPQSRLTAGEEKQIYELHENDPEDAGYLRFLSKLADPLTERLPPGAEGLDFGCGPGPALAGMLEEAGFAMALYDPFFHPGMASLDRSYDFITCTEVVEHLYEPAEVFSLLGRLLRPGGWLGIMTCFQTDDERFDNWHYRRDPTHVVFYRQATFEWLARKYGWALEVPVKDVVLLRKGR
ncbi:class I SAM-dependent methyltransferase [Marinobacter pelagius]|uniref:Methyltransferase domain-containing protein n=1 Tax=Marinobacter pelagius TaxID=379482 RepID=A0A1I5AB07_9GAMM|nr:class I SAM-dependent methyltransferase [Marinobacter pelagius]SFN59647.1 Methyltransferase domain-containing protein [Marinobacter pelagius]